MSALRDHQERFGHYINGGVDDSFALSIRDNGLSGERRLRIYQRSVTTGLCDALGGVYEVVKKLVGDEFFYHLGEHYLRKHHSRTGNVHDFGEAFPGFLKSFPGLESLPYLADVARFEWLYHTVFHSPAGEMLNIEKLSRVPESRYGQLSLLLSPSCRLYSSTYPVLHIWQANQEGSDSDETISLDEGGVQLAIVRHGKQVVLYPYQAAAFAMLDAISQGTKLDEACEKALQVDPFCNLEMVLQQAVMNRVIVGFAVNESP